MRAGGGAGQKNLPLYASLKRFSGSIPENDTVGQGDTVPEHRVRFGGTVTWLAARRPCQVIIQLPAIRFKTCSEGCRGGRAFPHGCGTLGSDPHPLPFASGFQRYPSPDRNHYPDFFPSVNSCIFDFSCPTHSERGGSGNSDSVISGSLASPAPPGGGDTKERGNETDETESRSSL